MDALASITAAADAAIAQRGLLDNPYFATLADGSMSLDQFRRSQEQFFWAVEFFSRPMAGLVARLPDPKQRLDILHNVVEEHGDFDVNRFHATTFKQFLASIGADVDGIPDLELWPEVRAFNCCLTTACLHDEIEVGVATMGVIEYSFADISQLIGQAVVARGFVSQEDLVHYKLHAQIDKRHAQEFFEVLVDQWGRDDRRYFIQQGIELGVYVFDRLYRDLLATARRPA